MSTVTRRPTPAETTAQDALQWGAVHLDVTDVDRSVEFYARLLGLQVLARDGDTARLGVEDAELVVLHGGAKHPQLRGHSGLYHLAIHVPSEQEFARVLARLFRSRYPNAPTDHVMHWATYLDDPDGINVEISFETLDRFAGYETGRGFGVRTTDGRVLPGTGHLDLDEVISHLQDRDLDAPLPAGARIGHLHMHVGDMDAACERYAALGFTPNFDLGSFADMSAGGTFPHRLAYNVWQGQGAPPQPPGAAGLRYAELRIAGREPVEFS